MCYKARVRALPATTEVAIVGGGFAGVATAWALARRGVGAIVLEREAELGRYASGRGAGLGRQLADDDDTTALVIRGAELLRGLPGAWSPTGGVLSFDRDDAAEAYAARARRFALAVEPLERDAVVARWPQLAGLRVARGLLVPSDGTIDVAALLAAFAAGIELACGAAALSVEPSARGARVVTTRGALDARVVVDAAGAWAGALTGDAPLAAYKRHLFVLDAVPTRGAWLWHLGDGELYLRAAAGATLASPCDAAPCAPGHQEADRDGEAALRARLAVIAPELARAAIARRWACQRSFTADRKMRLGRDPARPWLVWAAGLGGHGATAAAAIGERVAAAAIEALG